MEFRAFFKTSSLWEKIFGAGVLIYLGFCFFSFWHFQYLPFRDWYDWVLEGQILAHLSQPEFNSYYQPVKYPVPNSFASFFLGLFSRFLCPEQAGRLWLCISFLVFILGFWYCARWLVGGNSWGYLGLFLVWNHWFLIGNLNQHFGFGIFLLALARICFKKPERFSWKLVWELNFWGMFLFFIHFTVYFAFLIFLFFWFWEREKKILQSGLQVIFGTGISLIFLFWYLLKSLSGENTGRLFFWYHPFYHFYGWLYTLLPFASGGLESSLPQGFAWLNLFYLLLLHLLIFLGAGFFLFKFYSQAGREEKILLWTAGGFFLILVLAPFQLGKCNGFNFRFGFLFILTFLISVSREYQRYFKRLTQFISLGIAFVILGAFFSQAKKMQVPLSQLEQFLKSNISSGERAFYFIFYQPFEAGGKRKLVKYYYPQTGIIAHLYYSGGCYPNKFETGLILKTEKCPTYPASNLETKPVRFFKEQLDNLARDFDSIILVGRIKTTSRFISLVAEKFSPKKKSGLALYLEKKK